MKNHTHTMLLFLVAISCGLNSTIKDTAKETTDRVDSMLLRTQSNADLQIAELNRTLLRLSSDVRATATESTAKLAELVREIDGIAQTTVLLAGQEVQCNIATVNQYARDALEDLRAWWNERPKPQRDPFFCHTSPAYVRIDKLNDTPVPILFARGIRMSDERISFELVQRTDVVRLPGTPDRYLARQGAHTVGLNLRRLADDGLLSCAVEKIRYGWYTAPSMFRSIGEVFAGCTPPPPPTCPGGAPLVNGRCERCKFDIRIDAAGTSTWMFPGSGGLERHIMLQFTCRMNAGKRIRVQAHGDVSVDTQYQGPYGAWPRWLEMNLRTTGTSQTDCATGQKPTYNVEIQGNHKVAICGEWIANDDVTVYVAIERCKQGDARTTCTLQDNWAVEFAAMP